MFNQQDKNQFRPVPYENKKEQPLPMRFDVTEFETRSLSMTHPQEASLAELAPQSPGQVMSTPRQHRRVSASHLERNRRVALVLAALSATILLGLLAFTVRHFITRGVPDVTLYRVSMESADMQIGGGGIAYPVERLDISYPFAAHILSVFVRPGDRVTPNQPLVQIDLSQVNGQKLSQLQAQEAQAYQDMLASQSYLYSVLKLGNPVVVAQAQQQYSAAQAQYDTLVAEEQAPELHQGKIVSTLSGVITAVNVYPDQTVGANKILLTIFDESSIIVRVQIPLSNYSQVQINQRAQAIPSAQPAVSYSGTVISIIPNSDPQTGTFEVWVSVPNSRGSLLPGSNVFVNIQNTVRALVVPRLAVLNPDFDSTVFVERQQHVYLQQVQVLGYAGDSVLIASGLKANDLVVLVGLDTLQDGQAVQVRGIES